MATTTGTRTAAKKTAVQKVVVKKTATKPATKRTAAKKSTHHATDPSHYTQPELRERLKEQILAGDKGGRPGQWSARKAQLLAREYEAAGGGYQGGKSPAQQHLDEWTHEEWTTADGKPARRGETTARYLPKKAWDELTPAEQRATDKKKRAASKTGQQFVANTERAAEARRDATEESEAPAKRAPAKRPSAKRPSPKRPRA